MAKIWCEECKGSGIQRYIQMVHTDFTGICKGVNCGRKCPVCHGEGYTEANVVEVEEIRKFANGMQDPTEQQMLHELLDNLKEAK